MKFDDILLLVAGLGVGFGASAVLFMRVVVEKLHQLVTASTVAAQKLDEFHATGVQAVEEQNMHAVVKRIDDLEAKVLGQKLP